MYIYIVAPLETFKHTCQVATANGFSERHLVVSNNFEYFRARENANIIYILTESQQNFPKEQAKIYCCFSVDITNFIYQLRESKIHTFSFNLYFRLLLS